jgi:hypothetical protein
VKIRKDPLHGRVTAATGGEYRAGADDGQLNFSLRLVIDAASQRGDSAVIDAELPPATLVWLFQQIPPAVINQIAAIAHGGAMTRTTGQQPVPGTRTHRELPGLAALDLYDTSGPER